jgi:hypothetical protein
MNYMRVIPRDLFNEAKLLKCMGRLVIEAERHQRAIQIEFEETATPGFQIEQCEDDGNLYISNIIVTINGKPYFCYTTYNSKTNFPLYVDDIADADFESVRVFDETGEFTQEFKHLIEEGFTNETEDRN